MDTDIDETIIENATTICPICGRTRTGKMIGERFNELTRWDGKLIEEEPCYDCEAANANANAKT